MQLLQHPMNQLFMSSFWELRNRLNKDVGSKIRSHYGFDIGDMFLMKYVLEENVTPSQLADLMMIPLYGISRKLEALQELGMLERTLHPQDARKRVLTLTTKGQKTLKAAYAMMDEELDVFLAKLNKKELRVFIEHLEKLATDSS
ncbi:MAG: MarR family winged helix-turn-helix transcriptional regulator [Trueperaceae bacterium]